MAEIRYKTGIMGGTFDPFHRGHMILAQTAYEQFALDKVLIMPNSNPPHKQDMVNSLYHHRLEMVKLAVKKDIRLEASSLESSDKVHYTFQTLEYLKNRNPDTDYYFIIGADSLFEFQNWYHPEIIVQNAVILAATRHCASIDELKKQIDNLQSAYGGQFEILDTPNMDVASKEIREMIRNQEDVSYYLDSTVYEYIQKNHLYES